MTATPAIAEGYNATHYGYGVSNSSFTYHIIVLYRHWHQLPPSIKSSNEIQTWSQLCRSMRKAFRLTHFQASIFTNLGTGW